MVDVVQVLTESKSAKRYWSDLKRKLAQEAGSEQPYEEIVQLKLRRTLRPPAWVRTPPPPRAVKSALKATPKK